MGAQPCAFLVTVSDVAVVASDPFLGSVDADARVLLLLDDGQGVRVGCCGQGWRQGGGYFGTVLLEFAISTVLLELC